MASFKKLYHILNAVQTLNNPTRENIEAFVTRHDCSLSRSGFFQIRRELLTDYHIHLEFDKRSKTYHIETQDQENLAHIFSIGGIILRGELAHTLISDKEELLDKIAFEDVGKVKGIEHLDTIIEAILLQQKITIQYKRYQKQELKTMANLEPHFLKEYSGRFYLISYIPWGSNALTTAIDSRLISVTKQAETFTSKAGYLFDDYNHVVGLNFHQASNEFGIDKPTVVRFEVSEQQLPYLDDLRLHPSQKRTWKQRTCQNKTWHEFTLTVYPNYELMQKFLSMGSEVLVRSPEPFVHYIQKHLIRMADLYTNADLNETDKS